MKLRTRMAAVAGVAVALTVIALAIAQYGAARSTLRGQIDSALRDRAAQVQNSPGHRDGPGGNPGGGDFDDGGPPPHPLPQYATRIQNGNVEIMTRPLPVAESQT